MTLGLYDGVLLTRLLFLNESILTGFKLTRYKHPSLLVIHAKHCAMSLYA